MKHPLIFIPVIAICSTLLVWVPIVTLGLYRPKAEVKLEASPENAEQFAKTFICHKGVVLPVRKASVTYQNGSLWVEFFDGSSAEFTPGTDAFIIRKP